ncbi:MAG: hypothetical protein QM642_08560 [Edaphocola sp.]
MLLRCLPALLLLCVCFNGCKEKQNSATGQQSALPGRDSNQVVEIDTGVTYFSIRQFFDDQWKNREGNPYTLLKKIYVNNRLADSGFVALDAALWARLRTPFDATDISNKHYLGQYRFEQFDDETTGSRHLYYEAAKPDARLLKMDIQADPDNNRVRAIYLETKFKAQGGTVLQKLQYAPDRLFRIQEEVVANGKTQYTNSEYYFKY